jgi:tetratricopeptide (TPR) repeat protein
MKKGSHQLTSFIGFLFCIYCLASPITSWADNSFKLSFPTVQESSSLNVQNIVPVLAREDVKDAQKLINSGDVDKAIDKLQSIGSSSTEISGFAHKRLGDIYLDMKKDYQGAYKEYSKIANGEIPASSIVVGSAKLRLAYIKLHNKDYNGAISSFIELAQGNQPILYSDAYDAAIRAAHCYQHIGDYDNAAKLFKEIAKQPIPEKDASYAQLQLCGVFWEQGKTKKTYTEKTICFINSQNACQELLNNYPNSSDETRGIAELLYLEDYYFMDDYYKTIELANTWLTKYPKLKMQYITTLGWLAMSYYKTSQYGKCINICQEINNGTWTASDQYKNFNVSGYAYLYEASSYEKMGNSEKATELRAKCFEAYPSWYSIVINQIK